VSPAGVVSYFSEVDNDDIKEAEKEVGPNKIRRLIAEVGIRVVKARDVGKDAQRRNPSLFILFDESGSPLPFIF
jgi:hypothetical protein